ncbi:MAG: HEAT repeat domain-containing protein [Promethearchaeota archaeon]
MNKNFEKVKESKNPEIINDFLIELSKNPSKDHLKFLKYFIAKLDSQLFDKTRLNLIYLIGEIGNVSTLDSKCLEFLLKTYYTSDRWIRNEVIKAFGKILNKTDLSEDAIKLIAMAINDDYPPIRISALKALLNLKEMPIFVRRNVFLALNIKDSELEENCVKIFDKFLPDFNQLFKSLDYSENYQVLKPMGIRALLLAYFRSPFDLESFRQKISTSNWEIKFKDMYLNEIDTYEKILLKRL